jgi:hypothetical protein
VASRFSDDRSKREEVHRSLVDVLNLMEAAQETMARAQAAQTAAMTLSDGDAVHAAAEKEQSAAAALQQALQKREQLLSEACLQGFHARDLGELAGAIGDPEHGPLQARVERLREQSRKLQSECWKQWVIANRGFHHCREILEIIEHGSSGAPTYEEKPAARTGGALILDASV